jgi:hypothetical protein
VHASQVVARAVLAGDDVVLAGRGDSARTRLAQPRPVAADGDRGQRHGGRHDGEGVGGGELPGRAAQAERVDELHRVRADDVAPADRGAQLVAHVAAAAGLEPVDDEALRTAELPRHGVLDGSKRSAADTFSKAHDGGRRGVDRHARGGHRPRPGRR